MLFRVYVEHCPKVVTRDFGDSRDSIPPIAEIQMLLGIVASRPPQPTTTMA
jgi:hypothetical protein